MTTGRLGVLMAMDDGEAACPRTTSRGLIAITRAGWIPGEPITGMRLPAWKIACVT